RIPSQPTPSLFPYTTLFRSATDQIQHIFLEMYEVEENIKLDYLKIKVLELLLFLSNTDFKIPQRSRSYYPRKQIELIKEMKKYIDRKSTRLNSSHVSISYAV